MAFSIENSIVLMIRTLLLLVYAILATFFLKGYRKSVKRGLPNKFMLGYVFFYAFLSFYGGLAVIDEFGNVFEFYDILGVLAQDLDVLYGITPSYDLLFPNLANALYLFGIIMLMILIAAQVYPLENILNWKYFIATRFLIIVSVGLVLVYIPTLSYSLYSEILFICAVIGLFLGLVLNIGINIKIAATSSGDLKKRSISIIFASLLFYIGFLLTVGIQELSPFGSLGLASSMTGALDMLLGGILQVVSAILYWRGLRSNE
ncbi:MAG: hypothetical protein ACTSUE_00825 [Promethearchaeota archaeon]